MSNKLRLFIFRNHVLALTICAPVAVFAGPVVGLPPYYITGIQVVSLGTLGGNESVAKDVNDQGQIVGWARNSSGRKRAFFFHNAMSDITFGAEPYAEAHGINNNSQVVGVISDAGSLVQHGFFHDSANTFALLDETGSNSTCTTGSNPEAISDNGVITGEHLEDCGFGAFTPFSVRWMSWDAFWYGLMPKKSYPETPTHGHNINRYGYIVGDDAQGDYSSSGAWFWDDYSVHNVPVPGALPPQTWRHGVGHAFGINTAGNIVGDMTLDPDGIYGGERFQRAFFWSGTTTDSQALAVFSDGRSAGAYEIDDAGFVVGWANRLIGLSGFQKRAAVWHRDIGITQLPLPLGYGSGSEGQPNYCEALAVNNVSNTGLVKAVGYCHLNGTDRAILWNISTARGYVNGPG